MTNRPFGHFLWTYSRKYLLNSNKHNHMWMMTFPTKCYRKSSSIKFEIGHIRCFYACVIMWDWSGQYELDGTFLTYGVITKIIECDYQVLHCNFKSYINIYIFKIQCIQFWFCTSCGPLQQCELSIFFHL
jgi:hypothetical protein